ncbi:MAG: hypothetical protein J6T80_03455 [Paludibacteraceae bacterium]|nr:hypothetical protein [Paludibacteraceae bacterium]
MKKFFIIAAAAIIALTFNACKDKNAPDDKKKVTFAIEAQDVTSTTAKVVVTPSDSTIYYYFDLLTAADLAAGYNADSLVADMKASIKENGYKFPKYLSQGKDSWEWDGLFPETEYTIYALQFDSAYNRVGDWTLFKFTTLTLEIKETVNLTADGTYADYTDYGYPFFVDIPVGTGDAYIELAFTDALPEGAFTEEAFDADFGAWYVVSDDEYYAVYSAKLNGAMSNEKYKLTGELICTNAVKYVLDVTCEEESMEYAPAKKALKLNRSARK